MDSVLIAYLVYYRKKLVLEGTEVWSECEYPQYNSHTFSWTVTDGTKCMLWVQLPVSVHMFLKLAELQQWCNLLRIHIG